MPDFANPLNLSFQQATPYSAQFQTPNQQRNQTLLPSAIETLDPQNPLKDALSRALGQAQKRSKNDLLKRTSREIEGRIDDANDTRKKDRARFVGIEDRTLNTDRIRLDKQNVQQLGRIEGASAQEINEQIRNKNSTLTPAFRENSARQLHSDEPNDLVVKRDLSISNLPRTVQKPLDNDDSNTFQSPQPQAKTSSSPEQKPLDPLDLGSKVLQLNNPVSAQDLDTPSKLFYTVEPLKKYVPGDKVELINSQRDQEIVINDIVHTLTSKRNENDPANIEPIKEAINKDPRKNTVDDFYDIPTRKAESQDPIVVGDRNAQEKVRETRAQAIVDNPTGVEPPDPTENYIAETAPNPAKLHDKRLRDRLGEDPLFNVNKQLENGRTPPLPSPVPEEIKSVEADATEEEISTTNRELDNETFYTNPTSLPEEGLTPKDVIKERNVLSRRQDHTGDVAGNRVSQNIFNDDLAQTDEEKIESTYNQTFVLQDQLIEIDEQKTGVRHEKQDFATSEINARISRNQDITDQSVDIRVTKSNELVQAEGVSTKLRLALNSEDKLFNDSKILDTVDHAKNFNEYKAINEESYRGEITIALTERRSEFQEAERIARGDLRDRFDIDVGEKTKFLDVVLQKADKPIEAEQQPTKQDDDDTDQIEKQIEASTNTAYDISGKTRGNTGTNLGGEEQRVGLDQITGSQR